MQLLTVHGTRSAQDGPRRLVLSRLRSSCLCGIDLRKAVAKTQRYLFVLTAVSHRAAAMPAVVITGMNKSAAYEVGGPLNRKTMSAQWNAVYVEDSWRLIDVFWASTCVIGRPSGEWSLAEGGEVDEVDEDESDEGETVHIVNEFFFLTDPDMLICTHFPDDEAWQLLPGPLDLRSFETRLYMRERFFELGLYMTESSRHQCVLEAKRGELKLAFGMPPNVAKNTNFKFLLLKAKQSGDTAPTLPLEHYVLYEKSERLVKYSMRFPVAGRFKMDIFGKNKAVDDTYDLVCSYIIECPVPHSNTQPLPGCPDIGWGPDAEAETVGLRAKSHQEAVINTKSGEVEIRFDIDEVKSVLQHIRRNDLEEQILSRYAILRADNGELVLNARLPERGEYALSLFANSSDQWGELPNVCNYLVRCSGENIQPSPYPKLHEGILGAGFLASTLGVEPTTQKGGTIGTSDGKVNVSFVKPINVELLCELHSNDVDKSELMSHVKTTDSDKSVNFDMDLPRSGEYALNIFARRKGEEGRLHHVHTYLINSKQTVEEVVKPGKPFVPTLILTTDKGVMDVRVPFTGGPLMAEMRRKNAKELISGEQMTYRRKEDQGVFSVKLSEIGEYQLDVYEEKATRAVEHVRTFFLVRHEPLPEEGRVGGLLISSQSKVRARDHSVYSLTHTRTHTYIHVYIFVCVCVCV